MSAFTPLRVRSHGSLLYGTASPERLIERALEAGYAALALTDRDNLYLAVRFRQVALAQGLHPIAGAEIAQGPHTALLLALDRRGWANLCRLLTLRHLDERFDLVARLAELHHGLHVIVESPGLAASLAQAGVPPASGVRIGAGVRTSPGVRPAASGGGLWLGMRGLAGERVRLAERAEASRFLDVPLVATGDVVMRAATEHDAHRVAVTAAAGELIERMPPSAFAARDAWLAAPDEWERRVRAVAAGAGLPEVAAAALTNNRVVAGRCRLELELGTPIFPRAPLPEGETGPGYLLRLGLAGVERRYGRGPGASPAARVRAVRRLEHELSLIERLGFTDYFLLVADIVEFARARGIPSVGRGSGAGSIVSYVLGITNVDPIAHGLYFERFLHPQRRDCPDLDIDLCWRRRDEVIAHVYDTYGAEQVAMISTHATLGARSAFRETAKALGVPNDRVNALARRIPRELEAPYAPRLAALPGARDVDWREPPLAEALRLAESLDGAPRHLSVHSGGVVIGDRALTHYVPLERAAKGIVVTQFEMRAIEAIGLVKMDLLGNRALTTIGECVSLVREHRGVAVDVEALPDRDAEASAMVAAGDTLNCFQLESPAMRHLLRMLEARTLDETIAAVALVRPGPAESGMKEAYCRRHRGLEPVSFRHPRLQTVLGATHGVMLYEEDVMTVAAAMAGLSLAEGDQLRRAIAAARGDEEFRALERGFVGHCARAGVDADTARDVWRELTRFAAYAFCKAHAAGYGTLAWHSAWLKCHFPAEWAVGILNHHAGMYATWVHVEDLRRRGVRFLAPCVLRSSWDACLEVGAPLEVVSGAVAPGGVRGAAPYVGATNRAAAGTSGDGGTSRGRADPSVARMAERGEQERGEAGRVAERARDVPPSPGGAAAFDTCSAAAGIAVRVGLSRVFGLTEATGARIVAARSSRPFASLADFSDRVRPTLPELESLILAGALDWTGRSRPSLLLEARVGAKAGAVRSVRAAVPAAALVAANGAPIAPGLADDAGRPLAPDAVAVLGTPELPEFDLAARVRGEAQASGLWFSGHPLDVLVAGDAWRGVTPAAAVPRRAGSRVSVMGLPCATRRVETKSGGLMLFLTLADRTGLVECVLFPDAYRRFANAARGQVVRVEGRADETLGAVVVNAERVTALA